MDTDLLPAAACGIAVSLVLACSADPGPDTGGSATDTTMSSTTTTESTGGSGSESSATSRGSASGSATSTTAATDGSASVSGSGSASVTGGSCECDPNLCPFEFDPEISCDDHSTGQVCCDDQGQAWECTCGGALHPTGSVCDWVPVDCP